MYEIYTPTIDLYIISEKIIEEVHVIMIFCSNYPIRLASFWLQTNYSLFCCLAKNGILTLGAQRLAGHHLFGEEQLFSFVSLVFLGIYIFIFVVFIFLAVLFSLFLLKY